MNIFRQNYNEDLVQFPGVYLFLPVKVMDLFWKLLWEVPCAFPELGSFLDAHRLSDGFIQLPLFCLENVTLRTMQVIYSHATWEHNFNALFIWTLDWCGADRAGNKTWLCALAWHVGGVPARIEAVSDCRDLSAASKFSWKTMEQRKRLFSYIFLAAELCLSSTQVLRIGECNSCLRTELLTFRLIQSEPGPPVSQFSHYLTKKGGQL